MCREISFPHLLTHQHNNPSEFSGGFFFAMLRYYIIHKPFRILSQFSPVAGKHTLKDITDLAADVYPVGRLDYESEGLLILTNDPTVNNRLLNPAFSHEREYWVQVDGAIDSKALAALEAGVRINIDGADYTTKKCNAQVFVEAPSVSVRNPPIRYRKNIPASWIRLILTEGKNRQVRKMTAAVGFPTLRLIRYRINSLTLDGLEPGHIRSISLKEI